MSGIAEGLVRFAARLLPLSARYRYEEEWLADLRGAPEFRISSASVVGGALMTAMTMSRRDPVLAGLSLGELFTHRVRVAAGLLGSAAVLAAGYTGYGGYGNLLPPAAGMAVLGIAVVLAIVGTVALSRAVVVAVRSRRFGVSATLLLGALLVGIVIVAAPDVLFGTIVILGAPVLVIILFVVIPVAARGGRAARLGTRLALAGAFGTVTLVLAAVSVLHIAVWNPLARVPGRNLDQIYAALAEAGEATTLSVMLGAQVALTLVAALLLPVLVLVPRRRPVIGTTRAIVAAGFLLFTGATLVGFGSAFSMGMGLADTFATSGGDAAVSGPLLAIFGQLSLVVALLATTVRSPAGASSASGPPVSAEPAQSTPRTSKRRRPTAGAKPG